jgi:tripartite-type tricarboxylate transporter receptor subunit TctC
VRRGTPAPAMTRIVRDVREIMHSADMKKRYDEIGAYAVGSSPEDFEAFIRTETDKWQGLIKKVGIQPQ